MKNKVFVTALVFSLFAAPAAFAEMVNINKADVATLDSLDGIGEKKAEAIVAYRTEHGDFKTLEDLKEVSGIGDKLFDKIAADISLTDDATAVADTSDKEGAEKVETLKADTTVEKAEKSDNAEKSEVKADTQDKKADSSAKVEKVSDKVDTKADKT